MRQGGIDFVCVWSFLTVLQTTTSVATARACLRETTKRSRITPTQMYTFISLNPVVIQAVQQTRDGNQFVTGFPAIAFSLSLSLFLCLPIFPPSGSSLMCASRASSRVPLLMVSMSGELWKCRFQSKPSAAAERRTEAMMAREQPSRMCQSYGNGEASRHPPG